MSNEGMSAKAKNELLKLARNTLRKHFNQEEAPLDKNIPEFEQMNGAFVTLHKKGVLRGCIGLFEPTGPLGSTISSMAMSAAFEDPRFPPLDRDELENIDIEISVLTPLKKIENLEEIEVGKHGIYILKGLNRGVLLPQVAVEYGWDRNTFLAQTCVKAGLNSDCWKKGAEIFIFSAVIFGEGGNPS